VEGSLALAFRAALDAGFDDRPTFLVRVRNWWHELLYSNASIAQAKRTRVFTTDPARTSTGMARRGRHGVHLLLVHGRDEDAGGSADEQDGPRLQEGAAQGGGNLRRYRQRLGQPALLRLGEYGAHGTGINTTTEQVRETRRGDQAPRLEGKVEVLERDFREVPRQFDKLLSIGTLEHAGRDQLPEVIRAHADYLKPAAWRDSLHRPRRRARHRVLDTQVHLPGGWIPSLAEAIDWCERCGLDVVDIENLRRNYALTLDDWALRFDRNWDEVQRLDPKRFDEKFRRIWRSYLWSCAEMFRSPNRQDAPLQIVVSKGNIGDNYPMSRAFLYR